MTLSTDDVTARVIDARNQLNEFIRHLQAGDPAAGHTDRSEFYLHLMRFGLELRQRVNEIADALTTAAIVGAAVLAASEEANAKTSAREF